MRILALAALLLGRRLDDTEVAARNVTRPTWQVLDDTLSDFFGGAEVVQMYHLGAIDTLYEQGGLNHALNFRLTALAFKSMETESSQVVLCYQPSNMTISLVPIISDDGLSVTWSHLGASAVYTKDIDSDDGLSVTWSHLGASAAYTKDIDSDYWSSASYLASTTGSMFSAAVQLAAKYHQENPHYQPFSVYQKYPGRQLVAASSCDEFVWVLVEAANSKGVQVTPSILPKKIKIIVYADNKPVLIDIDDPSDGGGAAPRLEAVSYYRNLVIRLHPGDGGSSPRLEVVSYYRDLGVCLQTRKYSFITSLSDFAKYFDCLSSVAYIGLDQYRYLRINLTSSVMDHVVAPAVLPDIKRNRPSWIDIALITAILMGMTAGCQAALWRAEIPQHIRKRKWQRSARTSQDLSPEPPDIELLDMEGRESPDYSAELGEPPRAHRWEGVGAGEGDRGHVRGRTTGSFCAEEGARGGAADSPTAPDTPPGMRDTLSEPCPQRSGSLPLVPQPLFFWGGVTSALTVNEEDLDYYSDARPPWGRQETPKRLRSAGGLVPRAVDHYPWYLIIAQGTPKRLRATGGLVPRVVQPARRHARGGSKLPHSPAHKSRLSRAETLREPPR
ncbi:hypothetical protein JKP88DRAFT_346426 [Tribonema minus]|uniref:Uncharacterized protein n=1 Tax=Tribonema minus TaxID=303371 RepID=A0A835ZL91_9STRA|nr:hypothetical protein JKP88DRAFT_346426 [Tribonema minus]